MSNTETVPTMRDEYDFSKGERGKFCREDSLQEVTIHLDAEVLRYFSEKARLKGVALEQLVNDTLRKDIALVEGIK